MGATALKAWHDYMSGDKGVNLEDILAEDVVFHSPVVHTPQEGKQKTIMYLSAAAFVFGDSNFRYVREVVGDHDAILEFEAEIDGITLNGVDMIHFDAEGKIADFKVMVRPLKAINMIHKKMGEMLAQAQK